MQALSDGCHQFTTVAQNRSQCAGLSSLFAECGRQAQLLQQIRALLPAAVQPHCIHARLDEAQCLVVTVTSPVWAMRVRLQMLTVQRQLQAAGAAVLTYRIRVLPSSAPARTVTPSSADEVTVTPRLSTATRTHLEQTAAELVTNNPELAAVLLRLARR